MKRTMNWIAALVVGAGALAMPAMAHDRYDYRDDRYQNNRFDARHDNRYRYGREWRERGPRYMRFEHRNWDCR